MKLPFGFEIKRISSARGLTSVTGADRGWVTLVREWFPGQWQQHVEVDPETVLSFSAVYACITLIAHDVSKMRAKLVAQQASGIWKEIQNPAFSPVLRKPNHFQTRIKFFEKWVCSKLYRGNTYVLKRRDNRGVVTAMYVLDPDRVVPLIAPDGSVFYRLSADELAGIEEQVIVPAREIVHDTGPCLFHPLVGVTPIFACGLSSAQGIRIQQNSAKFFGNNSTPGGILTAPGEISDETASRLKTHWETNYTGDNSGKIAVLGDGLKFEAMTIKATDAQLIEQLKWTAENVCSTFHVPPYKIGIAPPPAMNNIEAMNREYYAQALQHPIECMELLLDEGLELPTPYGTEFETDALWRMDTVNRYAAHTEAIGGGWLKPNEARAKEDLEPVEGGDTPYMQQQNYSLAALNQRDTTNPFPPAPSPPAPLAPPDEQTDADAEEQARQIVDTIIKGLAANV